jgi:predicted O-linked N-acetylglucosamine transferase (SPINDLY family)
MNTPSRSATPTSDPADLDWGDLMQVVRHCEGLAATGQTEQAMQVYRQFLQHHRGGLAYVGLFNLSVLQSQIGQKMEAEASMRQAIRLKPDFFPSHMNLGTLLEGLGRQEEAVAVWKAALEMPEIEAPEHVDSLVQIANNLGRLQEILRRYDEAEVTLARSLRARPAQTPAISHWLHLRQKMCKWPAWHGLDMARDEVLQHASALGMMALSDDPVQQLECAQRFVREKVGTFERMVPRGHRYGHDRLRIGFLSSDLSMHAVSLLTVEMFEKFDRSKVEVHAFCWSKEDGTAFRERVRSAFDVFHKIGELSDEQAAQLIVDQEIDVVFDLQGITSGARPNIVARGPAPMQIAYLGYVGSCALPHVDHVIADKFIFPEELRPHFTEEPIFLPFFQVSDSQRVMGPKPTRAQFGLPEDAFVYCAFNNNYKLTPEVFESWMRILRQVPRGVLWLLEDNPWSRENLTRAAMAHGIDSSRLHFAGRIDPKDYLARFTVADLFLDTHPYGAGTTANDALWSGLPVLTMPGRTYVSRMAGAMLTGLGLQELIAPTSAEYERTACELALPQSELPRLRKTLQRFHPGSGVFDTERFVRELENELIPRFVDSPGNKGPARSTKRSQISLASPPQLSTPKLKVLVRGWRGLNHSYAMVNQQQLAVLTRQPNIQLCHQDLPMLANWTRNRNGSGLKPDVVDKIETIPDWKGESVDVCYSIASPLNLFAGSARSDLTFMVTEFGPTAETFIHTGGSGAVYTQGNRRVVTPSQWSRRKFVEAGLDPDRISVVPHGVDMTIFSPLSRDDRFATRRSLGLATDDFALLNVGGSFWNKGIDLLVRAYATLRRQHPHLRLILKDNRTLYGRTSEEIIAGVQREFPGLLTDNLLRGIVTVPGTLELSQLAQLYGAADVYVSPYRAEGFNLPVLEAMACGLRCVVTGGGATDDFFDPRAGLKLSAKTVSAEQARLPTGGDYLEPEFDSLIDCLEEEIDRGHRRWTPAGLPTWDQVTVQLLDHMKSTLTH